MIDYEYNTIDAEMTAYTVPQITSVQEVSSSGLFDYGGDGLNGDLNRLCACASVWKSIHEYIFDGIIERYCAHGRRITDLPSTRKLDGHDLFLTDLSNTNSITYDDFSIQLKNDMLRGFKLGSMAYEDELRYSPYDHNHDGMYVGFKTEQLQDYPDGLVVMSALVGTDKDDKNPQTQLVKVSDKGVYVGSNNTVGDLKFVFMKNGQTLPTNTSLMNSENFDGWLFPNGETITVTDRNRFAEAIRVYGSGNRFTLPNLNGFFKASCEPVRDISLVHPSHVSLKEHQHDVKDIPLTGKIVQSDGFSVQNYRGTQYPKKHPTHIHRGATIKKIENYDMTVDMSTQAIPNLSSSYSGSDQEFQPQHVRLPVMIFVGGVLPW